MSNYKGYLMKINGKQVPGRYLQNYKTTPYRQQDLNPWTDSEGVTHRNVLPHKRTTISFTTPPIYLEDKIELQLLLPDRTYIEVEYWNDETNEYVTGNFYITDVEFEVLMSYAETIAYRPITFELIEY